MPRGSGSYLAPENPGDHLQSLDYSLNGIYWNQSQRNHTYSMKQQVIQSFLNLPGIVGVALMDGRSRPYFCGIDQALNFQQKEALSEGIQQVLNTTPTGFKSFDFRFAHHNAHIYKLLGGVILLVLTDQQIDRVAYYQEVEALAQTLQDDPHSAVSTFRLLAESSTVNGHSYWSRTAAIADMPPSPASPLPPPLERPAAPSADVEWAVVLAALNALSDGTSRYLGKIVVANTWRSARPKDSPLSALAVDRNGHFSLAEVDSALEGQSLTPEERTHLRLWVVAFNERCARIIRDFPEMVLQQCLSDHQRATLQLEAEAVQDS